MPRAKKKIKFIERTYDRKIPTNNYLKHWRVVKYWVKKKYELSEADLEMLLFIQDEGLFGYEDFDEFQAIYPWDKGRFHRLKNNGWIRVWRKRDSWRNIAALYEISAKGRRMCTEVYKKLSGETDFSEVPRKNPVFKRKEYTDKVYSTRMAKINKANRIERLRHSHELPERAVGR
jgi:DNA-binding PadR family transcriptional regulator